jgi:hypothetical protein
MLDLLPAAGNQQLIAHGIAQRWSDAPKTPIVKQGTLF